MAAQAPSGTDEEADPDAGVRAYAVGDCDPMGVAPTATKTKNRKSLLETRVRCEVAAWLQVNVTTRHVDRAPRICLGEARV